MSKPSKPGKRTTVSFAASVEVAHELDRLASRYIDLPIKDPLGKRINKSAMFAAMAGYFQTLDDQSLVETTAKGFDKLGITYTLTKPPK